MKFILGLNDIIHDTELGEEQLKVEIKQYLQSLGLEWVVLWKEAHTMLSMSDETPESVYEKTLSGFRREKLSSLIKESQQELASCADEPQRQAEIFRRIRSLKSQLDSMVRG
jgi:hypothetical protein